MWKNYIKIIPGSIRKTYETLLQNINPELYELLQDMIEEEDRNKGVWDEYIDEIYLKLGSLSDGYKYLPTINKNESMFEFVLKLIRFFKSYTVDFVNSGIQYFLDDRYLMGLKLIDWMQVGEVKWPLNDNLFNRNNIYIDILNRVDLEYKVYQNIFLKEFIFREKNINMIDKEYLYDKMISIDIGSGSSYGGMLIKESISNRNMVNDFINTIDVTGITLKDRPKNRDHLLTDSVWITVNE